MSPRLKLQSAAKPLLLAGALWSAGFVAPAGAVGNGSGRPQTPPPCGPDGVCIPNIPTYGWYQTRWRTFPGDPSAKVPTAADLKAQEEKDVQEDLGGPQPPPMEMEGGLNRERPKRGANGAAEGGPVPDPNEDIRNLPGLPPLPGPGDAAGPAGAAPGGAAPGEAPAGNLPLGPEGAPPPAGTAPEGAADPLDPFGAAPPAPPWLSKSAMTNPAADLVQLPYVEEGPASKVVQPVDNIEPLLDGPNLHGEDAPPALPTALQRLSGLRSPTSGGVAYGAPVLPPAMAPARTAMAQPASVRPKLPTTGAIQQASVVVPVGGQLVNPAGSMEAIAEDQGAQQAIYIEASDSE